MDIVFLDIDGVLNCSTTKERVTPSVVGIDDRLVKNLADFIGHLKDPKIVLVSSWKIDWFPDEYLCSPAAKYMNAALAKHGLKIWTATSGSTFDRGKGIHEFVDYHKKNIDSWIVIDDSIFEDYDEEILHHLCQTNYHDGFDEDSIVRALKIIQNDSSATLEA